MKFRTQHPRWFNAIVVPDLKGRITRNMQDLHIRDFGTFLPSFLRAAHVQHIASVLVLGGRMNVPCARSFAARTLLPWRPTTVT
jgi:hypothetical protein